MRHADGFSSDPAFQLAGAPLLDTDELYYDGNSQGAILGGALCAVAKDFRRCVLGEAGMNYSTLLHRSVDFDTYKLILEAATQRTQFALNVIQMVGPARRTATRSFLRIRIRGRRTIRCARRRRHQVSSSAQVEARTIGAAGHVPSGPGREFGGEHGRHHADPELSVDARRVPVGHRLPPPLTNTPPRRHDPRRHAEDSGGAGAKDQFARERRDHRRVCAAVHRATILVEQRLRLGSR